MFFDSARRAGACLAICSLGLLGPVVARAEPDPQPAVAPGPLTLRAAITAAIDGNPSLKAFDYKLKAQQARLAQAGQRPALQAGVEVENWGGSGNANGFDVAETTLSISQILELGGKRGARLEVNRLEGDGVRIEQQAAQLDVVAEVVRRFVHIAADQEQLALTRQATQLAKNTVDAVSRRVQAAKSPEVELHRANVEYIRAQVELRHAEHELQVSRRKLAAMWGQPEAGFGEIEADLYRIPQLASFDDLVARLERNPQLSRFMTQARLRDAQIRLAEATRRGDVELSAGVRRFQEGGDTAFVGGISLPLFSSRRAAPAVAEAQALRGESEAAREAAFVDARAQLFEFYQELRHSVHEVETLKRDALPQMVEALQETQYAYDRGRYSFLELVDGQRAYLETQRAAIDAGLKVQTLLAEIERLTGEPLTQQETP